MKDLGMIRRIDDLGRIVIPKDVRKQLNIQEGNPMEIWLDDNDNIILKPYEDINGSISEILTNTIDSLNELQGNTKKNSNLEKIQIIIEKIIAIQEENDN